MQKPKSAAKIGPGWPRLLAFRLYSCFFDKKHENANYIYRHCLTFFSLYPHRVGSELISPHSVGMTSNGPTDNSPNSRPSATLRGAIFFIARRYLLSFSQY